MNDRDQGDQSDADWLAAQFGATGGVPTPKKPEPEKPVDPPAPVDPPTLVNPFGAPGAMPPPAGAGAAFPPPAGVGQPPAAAPPSGFPGFPSAGPPPTTQSPQYQPPAAPPSSAPPPVQQPTQPPAQSPFPPSAPAWSAPASAAVPPANPPAGPTPPAEPVPPAQPAASPFPWELAPGGDPASQLPPVVPIPPAAAPPAAPPPATPPGVPPAFPWEAPAAAAPHEPAPLDPAFDGGPQLAAEPPPAPMPWETARLPEVAPESADAPAFWEPAPTQAIDQPGWDGPPTQAMDQSGWADPAPTQLILPPTESFGAAAAATELLGASPDPANAPTSALDALFGESRFREYEAGADETENPFNRKAKEEPGTTKAAGVGTAQKVLLWVAGGLVGAIALVALFLVGTRLPDLLGPAPIVTQSASPSPSPSETALPVGPVAPGTYAWDELLGGECLDPYESPWAEEFTVVDCAVPHPAQMVFRGEFAIADPTNQAYPGEAELQSRLALLCSAPTVIDLAAAGLYSDVQFQASFPATEEQWDDGDRDYFCFVTRSSGEPLTGSIAVPPPPPAEPAAP